MNEYSGYLGTATAIEAEGYTRSAQRAAQAIRLLVTQAGLKDIRIQELEAAAAVPQGYVGGVLAGHRVSLEFDNQANAEAWFEKFCADYDAAAPQPPEAKREFAQWPCEVQPDGSVLVVDPSELPVPQSHTHKFRPNQKYPWFCADCGYAPHEVLMHGPNPEN